MEEKTLKIPKHVALIMDGNGRWAKKKRLPVSLGHNQGAKRLNDVLEVAQDCGIKHVTLYAFSTENWKRDSEEISHLFSIIKKFYSKEFRKLIKNEIKIKFIGESDNIPEDILKLFREMEQKSKDFDLLTLNIAFNYGSQSEIVTAVNKFIKSSNDKEEITSQDIEKNLYTYNQPPVDLLIRTSGEQRISNFLLWQIAYAELIFTDVLWPDFKKDEFYNVLEEYSLRDRRFGGR